MRRSPGCWRDALARGPADREHERRARGTVRADGAGAARRRAHSRRTASRRASPCTSGSATGRADLGALLGIWQAGAVAVPVHVAAAPATVERLQRRTQARIAVDGERVDVLGRTRAAGSPAAARRRTGHLHVGQHRRAKGRRDRPSAVRRQARGARSAARLRADDVVLLPLQLTFIFGLWVSLLALMTGARLVLVPRFSRDAIERGLADATVLAGVPSMFRTLLADHGPARAAPPSDFDRRRGARAETRRRDAALRRRRHLRSLRPDRDWLLRFLPRARRSAGRLRHHRQADRAAFRLPRCAARRTASCRSARPTRMLGYLDDPALTQASFADGYFKTGDLARLTAEGYVELVGRAKDIVSRGGHKIAPLEIDNLLAEHPESRRRCARACRTSASARSFMRSWSARRRRPRRRRAARLAARAHRALQGAGRVLLPRRPAGRIDRQGRPPRRRARLAAESRGGAGASAE